MQIDRETIDQLWQTAMRQSIEDGEQFTRYHFAKLVAEHEREACAKVAEQADNCMNDPYENAAAREIAAAIRARKNT